MRAPTNVVGSIAALAIPVLSTACAARGADYVRPDMPVPTEYRFVQDATEAASLADAPWWRVFENPALQALIRDAITHNLDLRAAVARVEEARAQAGIARSLLFPQVDATAAHTTQQNSEDGDVHQSGVYGFQLAWELDLFGRLRREKEAAYARVLAEDRGRRGVLVTLVADVATNYFRLRELDVELEIARRTLGVNDATVTYFQNRLDGGVSNRLELDRAKATREETAATLPDIERRRALVEHALSLLVGRPPGPIERTGPDAEPPAPPSVPPGVPAALLERRPDVMEAEQLLAAAHADVGAAKALFFPTISLTGFLGAVSGDLTTLLGGAGGVWSAAPAAIQHVFDGGRRRNNLDAAQARFDEALAMYQKAALNGYREVANALVAIQTLAGVRRARQAGVAALQDAAALARARYDSGLASYFEILDADQQLFQQELLLAQAHVTELEARADLYRALGGGWQP